MRLKRILEAFAERILCPEAHRNAWRNWISEGAQPTFGSQPPRQGGFTAPRFLDNEKTALSGCFFEEFSYENVNLYKGKLADSISFDFSPPMSLFLLMMLVYRRNMSEVCRFSKTFLKKLKRFLEFFNTSLYFIYIFPCHVFFIHLYTDISTFLPCSPLCKILMLQIPLQKMPAQLNHPLISGTVLEHNRSPLCRIR